MVFSTNRGDIIGLAKTELDAHTLGISAIEDILHECGFTTVVSDSPVAKAFSDPRELGNSSLIREWIRKNSITVLGFSYRLNCDDAVLIFQKLMYQLDVNKLLAESGGPLKKVCFAGLPEAAKRIEKKYGSRVSVFQGDETPLESLSLLGIDPGLVPESITEIHPYDSFLEDFGKDTVRKGDLSSVFPVDRHTSKNYGLKTERLIDRIRHSKENNLPPLIRAHAGPYQQNRMEAVREFIEWAKRLATSGYLDILSIGTSQLTQERFGEEWGDMPNGGGVPINSPEEYRMIYAASRPMLVRTYSGTKNQKKLARIYEETLNISWHALSLWWFSELDGRGPNPVSVNLKEHFEAIRYIASTGKPYEANVSHQFSFRGADDISYIVSAVLAARSARRLGIQDFILQIMLNDPKNTWGVNDLAKAGALLELVRESEGNGFTVYLQTRAGLNYLAHDFDKAKRQLAAVTALMEDIEPANTLSPEVIHVVSYSEGNYLATPEIIDDSIKITRYALDSYRNLKKKGETFDIGQDPDVLDRRRYLIDGARRVISAIEECIADPYSPEGLFAAFSMGFLPVPQLKYAREEFPEAVRWHTKLKRGGVDVYEGGKKISPKERMDLIKGEKAG
jgi:hypothetical protein